MVSSIMLSVALFVYPVVLTLCVTARSNYALYFHNQLSETNIETRYKSRIHNTPAHWREAPCLCFTSKIAAPKLNGVILTKWCTCHSEQVIRPVKKFPAVDATWKLIGAEEVRVKGEGRKVHNDELYDLYPSLRARGGAAGWGTALQAGRSRVRFPMVSLEFFINIILLAALWS